MTASILCENLGKEYKIRHLTRANYLTLRETLMRAILSIGNRSQRVKEEEFWALKNFNMQINEGERIGLIGRNGAGKSTLLKILSRITEPSSGRVSMRGRVASLLEVGTGFHPELTGQENIYLNGAILGMTKQEIQRKFDAIVDFADIAKFLDTPVKRYSSGMYVRLAFAVAAHLEPEILLVDEVLAVGDFEFRKKCLGKLQEVGASGRTVVYVSHDMSSIRYLCSRVILLANGQAIMDGEPDVVIDRYLTTAIGPGAGIHASRQRLPAPPGYHFIRVELRNASGTPSARYAAGDMMEIHLWANGPAPADAFTVEFKLHNERGQIISWGAANPIKTTLFKTQDQHFTCRLGPLPLTVASYSLSFISRIYGQERWDLWEHAIDFEVTRCDLFDTGFDVHSGGNGDFVMPQEWCAKHIDGSEIAKC